MKNRVSQPTAAGKLTGHRSPRALLRSWTLGPLLVLTALSVTAAPALAAEHWGVLGSFGLAPVDPAPLSDPAGLAVNQSTGDVYVVDKGNRRVEAFTTSGSFVNEFSPPGGFENPEAVAVDNSGSASDPSKEDVYVTDVGHKVIDKFSASGSYLGQIKTGSGGVPFVGLFGVAVDTGGVVWVENGKEHTINPAIDSFSDEQPNAFLASRTAKTETAVKSGLAVDSEDNLYLVTEEDLVVDKLSGAGALLVQEVGGLSGVSGITVDLASNDVYLDTGASVSIFDPAETFVESFGGGLLSGAGSLAVNPIAGVSGYAYVAEPATNDVLVLEHSETPPPPPSAPTTTTAEPTTISATLHGELNPEEAKGGVGYYFSYNTGSGSSCTGPGSVRTILDNGGFNPTGGSEVKVSATVTGLDPDTEYVYCLVADRFGATVGSSKPVTTEAVPPAIISESAFNETKEIGGFSAVVNPYNEATTYYFEYSTEGSTTENKLEGEEIERTGEASLPASFSDEPISASGLELKTLRTYYYRVVAKNGTGETIGKVQAYTKLPIITEEKVSEHTSTTAMLEASINPDFFKTDYAFEYSGNKAELEDGKGIVIHGTTGLLQHKKVEALENLEKRLEIEEKEEKAGLLPPETVLKEEEFAEQGGRLPRGAVVPSGLLPICPGIVEEGGIGTLSKELELHKPCPVSAEVSGLTPGHVYYYRVVTQNEVTESLRNINNGKPVVSEVVKEFMVYPAPAVTTGEAQDITATSATLSGEVNPEEVPTTYSFQYISETDYQAALKGNTEEQADPFVVGEAIAPISAGSAKAIETVGPNRTGGLRPGETYHYRLVATNQYGIQGIGQDHTFTTRSASPPLATTGAASGVTQNTATLSGTVSTNGLQTNYAFEIGTEPGVYGPPTGLGSIGGELTEPVTVALGELQPGTTYYYRVTATNADGTTHGEPGTFTTPGFPSLLSAPVSPPQIAVPATAFPTDVTESATPKSTKPKAKPKTRAQKLAAALKQCHRQPEKSRAKCERQAHSKYGPAAKGKRKTT